jgi:hypothetical protein
VNLVPTPAQVAVSGGQVAWTGLYSQWTATWDTFIKPQIDCCLGNNTGCNVVRIIGGNFGVLNGKYTQVQYNNAVLQLVQYLRSLNLGVGFYMGVGGYDNDFNGNLGAVPALAASVLSTMAVLQPYQDMIIGCDVIQEANSNVAVTTPYLQQLFAAIRKGNSVIPLTCSTSETLVNATGATWINANASLFDFIDCHIYYQATIPQFDFLRTTFPGHDILIGEFGASQEKTQDTQIDYYRRDLLLALQPDPKVRGGVVWAAGDQDTVNTNQFGMFDSNFAPKHTVLNVVRRATGGSVSKAISGHQ